jgi:hypothetical protein
VSDTPDADAIRATRERGLVAFNAGDVDEFLEVWPSDDIVVMVPGAPPVVDKTALSGHSNVLSVADVTSVETSRLTPYAPDGAVNS